MKAERYTMRRGLLIIGVMAVLVLIIAVVGINSGRMGLSFLEVLDVFAGKGTERQDFIVYELRLPRIVLSILVGIGMGASGCIMQSLLRNDMASPGTLGISSGSGLFVLVFMALFSGRGFSSVIALPLLAFVGGIVAAGMIFLLSYRRGRDISPTGLVLTGVALGSGYAALTMLLSFRLDQKQMEFIQRWEAGSLWGTDWEYLAILIPWTVLFGVYVFFRAHTLNTLSLGNETATGLGLAVKPAFLKLALAAVALSSGSVALGGNFFFLGMIAPHMARKLVGFDHRLLLVAASLAGAFIVLSADTITRTISFGTDVPTGIIITFLSTPYFLYLLAKAN